MRPVVAMDGILSDFGGVRHAAATNGGFGGAKGCQLA
jgi:hypothetical protein